MNVSVVIPAKQQPITFPEGFVQSFLREINTLRTNPQSYISVLDKYVSSYPLSEIEDARVYLQRRSPCGPLSLNPLLSEMAQRWVNEQGPTGGDGHGNVQLRLQQANIPLLSGSYTFGENIAYGFVDPQDILIAWIVDYQVPGKGHRTNLFKCDQNQIGIAFGPHARYRVMVLNEYGAGFASSRVVGRRRTVKW